MIECTCANWQTHWARIVIEETVALFRYCPWCGKRLTTTENPALLAKFRQRIRQDFRNETSWRMPDLPSMDKIKRHIEDYREMMADTSGVLDLMLTYVEEGTAFTNRYGDIDESFYIALETMLEEYVDLLLANPKLYEEHNFSLRVFEVRRDAPPIGWGYGDTVFDQIERIQEHFGDY